SGAGLLPLAVTSMISASTAGRLGNRFGERAVAVPSCLTVAAGLVMLATRLGPTPQFWTGRVPGAAVVGAGLGLSYAMIGAACVREVDHQDLSVASAANRMTLQIGNAIGIALTIAIIGDAKGHDIIDPMREAFMVMAVLAAGVAGSMWLT